MNTSKYGEQPLTEDELARWNDEHPHQQWKQVNRRFIGEVIAEPEGIKIVRDVAANEDVRAFLEIANGV